MKKILLVLLLFAGSSPGAYAARLDFSPSAITTTPNNDVEVDIVLNPEGSSIVGTDMIIRYNPDEVSLEEVVSTSAFSTNPATVRDEENGVLQLSLVHSRGVTLTETKTIATLTFKAKPGFSSTEIGFDYVPGTTNKSTVVSESTQNVLFGVNSLTLSLPGNAGSTPNNSANPSSTPSTPLTSSVADLNSPSLRSTGSSTRERVLQDLNDQSEGSVAGIIDESGGSTIETVGTDQSRSPVQGKVLGTTSSSNTYQWLYLLGMLSVGVGLFMLGFLAAYGMQQSRLAYS